MPTCMQAASIPTATSPLRLMACVPQEYATTETAIAPESGRKLSSKFGVARNVTAWTPAAINGWLRRTATVAPMRTTAIGARTEFVSSGLVNSSNRAKLVNATASAGSNQRLVRRHLRANRSAMGSDRRQARPQNPTTQARALGAEASPVRGDSLACGEHRGVGAAPVARQAAHLELERPGQVVELDGGRLAIVTANCDQRVLQNPVGRELHAAWQGAALPLDLEVDQPPAPARLCEQGLDLRQRRPGGARSA